MEFLLTKRRPCSPRDRYRPFAATMTGGASPTGRSGRTPQTSNPRRGVLKPTVPSWSATVEGVRVAAHHARPGSDMNGVMPDATAAEVDQALRAAEADVLLVGHTRRAMELCPGVKLVLNPGAVLREPADGWERASSRRRGRSECSSCPRGSGRCSGRGRGSRSRS